MAIKNDHNENEILTDEQVSEILGLKPRTLRRYRQERGLPHMKLSARVVRYRRGDVEQWAANLSQAIHE